MSASSQMQQTSSGDKTGCHKEHRGTLRPPGGVYEAGSSVVRGFGWGGVGLLSVPPPPPRPPFDALQWWPSAEDHAHCRACSAFPLLCVVRHGGERVPGAGL